MTIVAFATDEIKIACDLRRTFVKNLKNRKIILPNQSLKIRLSQINVFMFEMASSCRVGSSTSL